MEFKLIFLYLVVYELLVPNEVTTETITGCCLDFAIFSSRVVLGSILQVMTVYANLEIAEKTMSIYFLFVSKKILFTVFTTNTGSRKIDVLIYKRKCISSMVYLNFRNLYHTWVGATKCFLGLKRLASEKNM